METKIRKPHRTHTKLLFRASENIVRLEANINYTTFILNGGKQKIMSYTLKKYDSMLPHSFVRVNRSCIVNINFIANLNFDHKTVLLKDGTEILISRRRLETVRQNMFAVA
ncbi:LytR/AlgR family response regulator transcription factor [Emticicia agri]|uniref:LytTR family transcriptional regulator n=1 Tax=Emticicia agri TaxID=2492393 RepID=A0A4Q5LXZ2_9BACT|nr:LytTR family DNA-binding domain-containing protein [Emticicia agri]RYU94393.1 LytTR family transcriptional regulator [Emticicia agri]